MKTSHHIHTNPTIHNHMPKAHICNNNNTQKTHACNNNNNNNNNTHTTTTTTMIKKDYLDLGLSLAVAPISHLSVGRMGIPLVLCVSLSLHSFITQLIIHIIHVGIFLHLFGSCICFHFHLIHFIIQIVCGSVEVIQCHCFLHHIQYVWQLPHAF